MEFNLKITAKAGRDVDNAIEFYVSKSKKVAEKFKKSLIKNYKLILENPYFQINYDDVRSLPIKDFPYIIFFRIREDTKIIDILSVFCTHQNPEKYP